MKFIIQISKNVKNLSSVSSLGITKTHDFFSLNFKEFTENSYNTYLEKFKTFDNENIVLNVCEIYDWETFTKQYFKEPRFLSHTLKHINYNAPTIEAGISLYKYITTLDKSNLSLPFYSYYLLWAGNCERYLSNLIFNERKDYSNLSKIIYPYNVTTTTCEKIDKIHIQRLVNCKQALIKSFILNDLEPIIKSYGPYYDKLTIVRITSALSRVTFTSIKDFEEHLKCYLRYIRVNSVCIHNFTYLSSLFFINQHLHSDYTTLAWSFLKYLTFNDDLAFQCIYKYLKDKMNFNFDQDLAKNFIITFDNINELLHLGLLLDNGCISKEERLQTMLQFLIDPSNSLIISHHFITLIKDFVENLQGSKWKGTYTSFTNGGQCQNCKQFVKSLKISLPDFEAMKDSFYQQIICREDVYLNSNPKELQRYLNFIKSVKYDIVIDALNLCLGLGYDSNFKKIQCLQQAIEYFTRYKQRKVLLIGRKHMLSWDIKGILANIFRAYPTFLLDNTSEDDPYLLYATMYGGLGTFIFSRDTFRDHKFNLGKSSNTFENWRKMHQIFLLKIQPNGQLQTLPTLKYAIKSQINETGDVYHIPYVSGVPLSVYENINTWLCLRKYSDKQTSPPIKLKNIFSQN